ncbi:AraC family transcriptional regulator [Tissierella praeacuta]|uniref:helix-turn-helix domain-containing protein n=1 Tax=Tissierella praeacuta TaxID=43131 RepID=UPI00334117D6
MTTTQLLQKSIDYIEENLKSELSLSELAEISGFSTYYFCRIFSSYVGIPVSAFITKRRLYHGIYEIQSGKKTIDIALLYGFDTYAGFFKAFKREFGCSPSKFLKLNTAKRPIAVNLIREAKFMLTQREIKQLLSNWDLDLKLEIEDTFASGGTVKVNDTWLIDEEYIFKTGKNIAGLKTHIAISRELEKSGIIAATPIKTIKDEDFVIEDDRYFYLTNAIKGKFLTPEERYAGNRIETGKKYGEAIGNLHKILRKQDKNLETNDNNLIKYVIYSIQMIFIAWLNGKEEYKNLAMQNRKMLIWIWENKDKCFGNL